MRPSTRTTLIRNGALAIATGLIAGCSLQPVASEEMARARMSIDAAARMAGAVHAPELKRAQEKVALAQRWVDAKDHGPARWLAEQAEVDAELALARIAAQAARRTLAEGEARNALVRTSFQQASIGETSK